MRVKNWFAIIGGLSIVCAISAVRLEEKKPAHDYAGSKKCRICHNVTSKGKMYDVWEKTLHAHAYETLLTNEAKEAAKKLGIDKPEKSGECLRCHATAYGTTKKPVTKKVKPEDGVGCESCHGAGKDYSTLTIMKELDKAAVSYQIVFTKADKIGREEQEALMEKSRAELSRHVAAHPDMLMTSSVKGWGIEELRAMLASLAEGAPQEEPPA